MIFRRLTGPGHSARRVYLLSFPKSWFVNHGIQALAGGKAVLDLRAVCASDRRHHRSVRLQLAPGRGADPRHRDRQHGRAQCRARQLAGLCGRDGVARRLHVDRSGGGEEIRRRAFEVQRQHSRCREALGGDRPGRRCRAIRDLQEAHRAVRRIPQGAGAARQRDQPGGGPRMGRQRRQPLGALGAEQGSRGAVQGLYRARQAHRGAKRGRPPTLAGADLPRRHRAAAGRRRHRHHRALDRPAALGHHRDHQAGRRGC